MRQNWALFIASVAMIVVASAFMSKTQAEAPAEPGKSEKLSSPETASSSTTPKKIEDASISGLKTEVPASADLETNLQKREKELTERDARVREAGERLKAEEARMKLKIDELEKLQSELAAVEEKSKKTDEAILARMVKTFETMQPKKAAGVLASLSDDAAIELCLKLKEKKLASIFDVMDPARATQLSTLLYNRRPTVVGRSVASEKKSQGAGLAPKK